MSKFKILLLQLLIVLATIVPSYSSDNQDQTNNRSRYHYSYLGLGNFDYVPLDDLYDDPPIPVTVPHNHAFVPDSYGNSQGREALTLLFAGQEDPATVRIATRTTYDQYTFRERAYYAISGQKVLGSYLTGTITPDGILTNGHGFVQKVPSVTNRFLELIGSDKFYYRTLEPITIEQGLTLQPFTPEDRNLYYKLTTHLPTHLYSHHAIYVQEEIDSVHINPRYMQDLREENGWFYGKLDTSADVALINVSEHHQFSHICPVAEKYPFKENQIRVKIYQYPGGHPLQKMAQENANFSTHTHQCATLPGSSGSALRDEQSGEIIGVHQAGHPKEIYNYFIPFDRTIAKEINFKLYSRDKNVDIVNRRELNVTE